MRDRIALLVLLGATYALTHLEPWASFLYTVRLWLLGC